MMFTNNLRNVVAIAICLASIMMFSGCNKDGDDKSNNSSKNYGYIKYDGKTYDISSAYRDEMSFLGHTTWFHLNANKDGIVVVAEIKRDEDDNAGVDGTYTHTQNDWLITVEEHSNNSFRSIRCSSNAYVEIKSLGGDKYELSGSGTTTEGKSVEFSFSGTAKINSPF